MKALLKEIILVFASAVMDVVSTSSVGGAKEVYTPYTKK
jgi:hypothetical protein